MSSSSRHSLTALSEKWTTRITQSATTINSRLWKQPLYPLSRRVRGPDRRSTEPSHRHPLRWGVPSCGIRHALRSPTSDQQESPRLRRQSHLCFANGCLGTQSQSWDRSLGLCPQQQPHSRRVRAHVDGMGLQRACTNDGYDATTGASFAGAADARQRASVISTRLYREPLSCCSDRLFEHMRAAAHSTTSSSGPSIPSGPSR